MEPADGVNENIGFESTSVERFFVLKWPDTANAWPEYFKDLVIEPFLRFLIWWYSSSDSREDVAGSPENMMVIGGFENMLCDFEPFIVIFQVITGAEKIIKLLVGVFVLENVFEDLIQGFIGKLKPTGVGKELVEIFDLIFVDDELFLSKEKGINGGMEFLLEKAEW